MNIQIDTNDPEPAYLQIYNHLKKDIEMGVYPFGAKLPSKRTLAEDAGLSVIPIEHAYALLCEEGYAESRQRSGYFVLYRSDDFITISEPSYTHNIKHNTITHSNRTMSYQILSKTTRKVLLDYGEELLIKSPGNGCDALREAISQYLARSNNIHVSADQIIIGSGAEYLYGLLVQFFGKNQVFAIEDPSYEKIHQVYDAYDIVYDKLPLGHNGIQSDALRHSSATVLHVTPFNSYPSGISADASKRREYIRWAENRNGYIIEDNYESELTVSKKNDDTIFSIAESPCVIYLNTFSKTVAPSIRVGYMVLPKELVDRFNRKLGFYSCTVPVLEQFILAELLQSGDFERHINRVRRERRKLINK